MSTELLQMNLEFRQKTSATVKRLRRILKASTSSTKRSFPSDFEVVYAIIAPWKGRRCTDALRFFSKVSLREAMTNLRSRGFR